MLMRTFQHNSSKGGAKRGFFCPAASPFSSEKSWGEVAPDSSKSLSSWRLQASKPWIKQIAPVPLYRLLLQDRCLSH
jgi:hypothetical protein